VRGADGLGLRRAALAQEELVAAHLNIPVEVLATFPRTTQGIVPLPGKG